MFLQRKKGWVSRDTVMGKFIIVTLSLTLVHFSEDIIWFIIGRYTEVPFLFVAVGIILFSSVMGYVIRQPRIKDFLGK